MATRHRDLDSARQFGRSLQYLHDLQPATVASGNDILPILAVNNVLYDAQPKQVTVSGLATSLSPYITAGVSSTSASLADVIVVSGGTTLDAVDAGSDKLAFWDDSESKFTYLTVGSGLSISGTVISSTGAGGGTASASGINGSIQYYSGGILAGDTNFLWDSGLDLLSVVNTTGVVASGGVAVTSGNLNLNFGDAILNDGGTYTTTLQCVTPTANRTISFPDNTGTVALVAGSSSQLIYNNAGVNAGISTFTVNSSGELTLSSRFTNTYTSLVSAPAETFTGVWYASGTSTTTKPHVLIEPAGATSTSWSTAGTGFGVNAASTFGGRLIDLQLNGTPRWHVRSDGGVVFTQGAPAAVNTTATLTVANIQTGIITTTTASGVDMTLPSGTLMDGGFAGTFDNMAVMWSVINTGGNSATLISGASHSIVGAPAVTSGTSGRFTSRRTASTTWVTYRVS